MNTMLLSHNSWSSVVPFQVFHGHFTPLRVPIESFLRDVSITFPEMVHFHFLFFYSISIGSWWVSCHNSWSLIALVHHIFQLTWVICWHMSAVLVIFDVPFHISHPWSELLLPLCYLGSRSLIWCCFVIYFYISFFVATSDEFPAPLRLHHWER